MALDIPSYEIGKKSAGGSGTTDYTELSNKPSINDVTLTGNKTSSDLKLQGEIDSNNKLNADLVDDTSSTNKFVTSEEKTTWSGKQDTLTFDTTPTQNSTNPVTSNGIYEALSSAGGIKMEAYNSFQSSFNIYDTDIGIYNFKNQDGGINFYYDKTRPNVSFLKSYTDKIMDLTIIKKVDWQSTATATEIYAYLTYWNGSRISKYYFYRTSGNQNANYVETVFANNLAVTNNSATISGSWNFNALPTAKSSLKPNYANQLVPRSFVDNYIASNYNSNNTYAVGDLVIYGTDLYQCNTAIETPEAWDSTKWAQTTLAAAIKGSSS